MPTYHCTAPAGLLDAAKKAAIAKEITRIHNAVTRSLRVVPAKAGTHILSDPDQTDAVFQNAKKAIDKVSKGDLSRDTIRTITMTQDLIKLLEKP